MSRVDVNRWVDVYADSLYSYALFRMENTSIAEELVQETFVAALDARSRFSGKSSEKTWLFSILKNKIYDHLRQKYKERAVAQDQLEDVLEDDFFDAKGGWKKKPERWAENPQRNFEEREFLTVLKVCLDRLPKKQGHVFIMRELDEQSNEEICKVLNVSPTNYWVLMHRARLGIRKCLEKSWF